MDKPRYRYNHKNKTWDQLYSFGQYECRGVDPKTGLAIVTETIPYLMAKNKRKKLKQSTRPRAFWMLTDNKDCIK